MNLKEKFEKDPTYEGYEVIFGAQIGSHNYGTNDETSDYDYKVFLMPKFDELYNKKLISIPALKIEDNDYEFKDIRKFVELLSKSNQTYLEILASKQVYINPKYEEFVKWFYDNKKQIANVNLNGLLNAMRGMMMEKLTAIFKDYPNSQENEGYKRRMKWGFDSKQLLHVRRLGAMRAEILDWGINPIEVYDLTQEFVDGSHLKGLVNELLAIKHNDRGLTKEQALQEADKILQGPFMEKATGYIVDEELIDTMKQKVFDLVKKEIIG